MWPTSKRDRKSTRLNSSHGYISYAVFCLKKKKQTSLGLPILATGSGYALSSSSATGLRKNPPAGRHLRPPATPTPHRQLTPRRASTISVRDRVGRIIIASHIDATKDNLTPVAAILQTLLRPVGARLQRVCVCCPHPRPARSNRSSFFFFNNPAPPEFPPFPHPDALPI